MKQVFDRDPAYILHSLADHVQETLSQVAEQGLMEGDSPQFKEAQVLTAKLNLARMTMDKTIISVTGLQSSGKSTMVKRLYDFEANMLPVVAGRGEALPILLTESESMQEGSFAWKVRRSVMKNEEGKVSFMMEDSFVSHEDFLKIARLPEPTDLWLEVLVPVRYFGSGVSLALLPGYERDKTERSQRDLEFMLSLSTSVVFVLNPRMLARSDQHEKIHEMVARYKEHAPLFHVSFSDDMDDTEKAHYRKLLSKNFNISEEEMGRVTFSGKEEDTDWRNTVAASINEYGKLTTYTYRKHMEVIRDLSTGAIQFAKAVEELVEEKLSEREGNEESGVSSEVLAAFRRAKKKFKDKLEKELETSLKLHAAGCSKDMDRYLAGQNDIMTNIRHFFKGDQITLIERIEFREKTMDVWNGKNRNASETLILDVLQNSFEEQAKKLGFTGEDAPKQIQAGTNPFLQSAGQSTAVAPSFTALKMNGPEAMNRLVSYLKQTDAGVPVKLEKEDMQLLPFMATGFALQLVAASPVLVGDPELPRAKSLEKAEALSKKIGDVGFEASTILKGMALFMGIDAADGTFDTFGALSQLLIKLGVSGSAANPAAAVIIGGVTGAIAVKTGMQKVEQHRLNQSTYASNAFQAIAVQQKEAVLETVERILDKMEDSLVSIHRLKSLEDLRYGMLDTTKYTAARVKALSSALQGMTYKHELYLG